jgi:hypothetical protein
VQPIRHSYAHYGFQLPTALRLVWVTPKFYIGTMIECQSCTREFVNWHAVEQHMDALGHWAPDSPSPQSGYYTDDDAPLVFECEACSEDFDSFDAARQHMDAYDHWRIHWCNSCEKGFQNENNLRQVSMFLRRQHAGTD